jgi:hypothetical protein
LPLASPERRYKKRHQTQEAEIRSRAKREKVHSQGRPGTAKVNPARRKAAEDTQRKKAEVEASSRARRTKPRQSQNQGGARTEKKSGIFFPVISFQFKTVSIQFWRVLAYDCFCPITGSPNKGFRTFKHSLIKTLQF